MLQACASPSSPREVGPGGELQEFVHGKTLYGISANRVVAVGDAAGNKVQLEKHGVIWYEKRVPDDLALPAGLEQTKLLGSNRARKKRACETDKRARTQSSVRYQFSDESRSCRSGARVKVASTVALPDDEDVYDGDPNEDSAHSTDELSSQALPDSAKLHVAQRRDERSTNTSARNRAKTAMPGDTDDLNEQEIVDSQIEALVARGQWSGACARGRKPMETSREYSQEDVGMVSDVALKAELKRSRETLRASSIKPASSCSRGVQRDEGNIINQQVSQRLSKHAQAAQRNRQDRLQARFVLGALHARGKVVLRQG